MMNAIRQPAVAGTFYPGKAGDLQKTVRTLLNTAPKIEAGNPKAMIAPHAGYFYSGPVAATVYQCLARSEAGQTTRRVVLAGPAHFAACRGLALSSAEAFATPLGTVPLDKEAARRLLKLPQVSIMDAAHAREHSLEVHLPFLQTVLGEFSLIPMAAGDVTPSEVAAALAMLWPDPETLIVISSDLSHFYDYETAQQRDQATARAIEGLLPEAVTPDGACGSVLIQGLLRLARQFNLTVKRVDLRNSGDTAGSRAEVVGYGAWVFG